MSKDAALTTVEAQEVAEASRSAYALTAGNIFDMLAESGDNHIQLKDLDSLKIPSGGDTFWTVKNPETGEEEKTKVINGIIILVQEHRSFYKNRQPQAGESKAPDCVSEDMKHGRIIRFDGVAREGVEALGITGNCETCPLAKWKTDPKTGRKIAPPCNNRLRLYILPLADEDHTSCIVPAVLDLPGTSITPMKALLRHMLVKMNMKPYYHVPVKLTLEKKVFGSNATSVLVPVVNYAAMNTLSTADKVNLVKLNKAWASEMKPRRATDDDENLVDAMQPKASGDDGDVIASEEI